MYSVTISFSCSHFCSLNLLGWVSRSTSDVDIIFAAVVDAKGKAKLLPGILLSPKFTDLVADVGHELGIKEEWLIFGPAPLMEFGLPSGLEDRLKRHSFGPCLALFMVIVRIIHALFFTHYTLSEFWEWDS